MLLTKQTQRIESASFKLVHEHPKCYTRLQTNTLKSSANKMRNEYIRQL